MSRTVSRKRLKWRLFLLKALSLIACTGPLAVVFLANFDRYVTTVEEGIKLAGGGILVIVLIAIIVLGKMKMPPIVVVCGTVSLIAWLIQPILADLAMLGVITTSGALVDYIIIKPLIRKTKEALLIDRAADETTARVTEQVEEMLKNYTGRV
jgi:peptidoglycan/LPS O-acetylase OafA/YrhL